MSTENTASPATPSNQGQIKMTAKGVGYVVRSLLKDPALPDVEVAPEDTLTALNGDTVAFRLSGTTPFGKPAGVVTEIITRKKTRFVGTIEKHGTGLLVVIPDDQKMHVPLALTKKDSEKVARGEKVYVEFLEWTDPKKLPTVTLLKKIGLKGNNDVEMESIVLEKGFVAGFPPHIEKEAESLRGPISSEEITKRRDMRSVPTFTIDPADAKDFDDAISLRTLENGDIEVGVHIADVSHYVRPGTKLDEEARKRATSIYLVDRTIPMLPEALSNDLCSLNAHEDKLAFSAIFTFDPKVIDRGETTIKDAWYGRTVIHSDQRFTYESAQEVLDGKKDGPFRDELLLSDKIALNLRNARFANGAISFEKDEVKFRLDDTGKPIGVYLKTRIETMRMIEDLMLLANQKVAQFIGGTDGPDGERVFPYRIHDVPNPEKIENLRDFAETLGFKLITKQPTPTPKEMNKLLESVHGTVYETMIQTLTLRTMAKAIYSTNNIGHYGLGFEFYTHFTSPIRRYPDVMVHRMLAEYLSGKKPNMANHVYEEQLRHSTDQEIAAAEAERTSIKLKQAEYMMTKVGQTFTGTITGVSPWGIYVEENETKCEGMVRLRNLPGDFYNIDEKTHSVVGEKTKKRFTLGQSVQMKVLSADADKRIIDYGIVA